MWVKEILEKAYTFKECCYTFVTDLIILVNKTFTKIYLKLSILEEYFVTVLCNNYLSTSELKKVQKETC